MLLRCASFSGGVFGGSKAGVICGVSSGSRNSWAKAKQFKKCNPCVHVYVCVFSYALICVHMQTSDVSAELRSSSPSVELLSESLSLLRKENTDRGFLIGSVTAQVVVHVQENKKLNTY